MHANRAYVESIVTLAVCTVLAGCSITGYGIGKSIDESKPNDAVFAPDAVHKIAINADVTAILRNDSRVSGSFVAVDILPAEEYARAFTDRRRNSEGQDILPPLGASILLFAKSRNEEYVHRVELVGFDPGLVHVRTASSGSLVDVLIAHIDSLSVPGGGSISGTGLQRMMKEGEIPCISRLVLSTLSGRVTIPLESIVEIRQESSRFARWIGLGIGLAIDVTLTVLLIKNPPSFDLGWGP